MYIEILFHCISRGKHLGSIDEGQNDRDRDAARVKYR